METNSILKQQAAELLKSYEVVSNGGLVTGSFALDLMVCPDLDLYVPEDQVQSVFRLAEAIYQNHLTDELYIQKGATLGISEGQHIQVRTNLLSEHAKWKIDVWILPAGAISQKSAQIDSLNERLTDADREQILELKRQLLQPNGFTPKYSGIHIYRAYLDEGIRELASLKDYLRSKGISLV
ncbi:MAG TPA: hypothetical protein VIF81_01510 [Pyrinomonadaceae bacterium]